MTQTSFNCIVCGKEFTEDELQSVTLSKVNVTRFKICQVCLDRSNPEDDYNEAKRIISVYLDSVQAKHLLEGSGDIVII
jgi:transcription elongation factor Elf1